MEAWRGKCFCCNCCCVLRRAKADDALHEILAPPQAPHVAARLVPRELAKADDALHEILAPPQAPHMTARLVPGELAAVGGEGCRSTHGSPSLLPVTAPVTSGPWLHALSYTAICTWTTAISYMTIYIWTTAISYMTMYTLDYSN